MRFPFTRHACAALLLCGPAAAQTLDQIITSLRSRVLPAGWMENYAADGILNDHGTALWEMPTTYPSGSMQLPVLGGGYSNDVRQLTVDPAFYWSLAMPQTLQYLFTQAELNQLWSTIFNQPYSAMFLPDFGTTYNSGTSVALQNLVFAPAKSGSTVSFHTYPEVDSILNAAGGQMLRTWANIGMSNNWMFFENDLELSLLHGQQRKTADGLMAFLFDPVVLAGLGIPQETFLHLNPATFILAPDKGWVEPMLDFLDPTVLTLALQSVEQIVQTYQTRMRYFVGGEFFTGHTEPGATICSNGVAEPTTNYSPRSITSFQKYMEKITNGNIATLNARWGSSFTSYSQIAKTHVACSFSPQAVLDFVTCQGFLARELLLLQYRRAKSKAARGLMGTWSFGTRGIEESWLDSDLPASGEWYGSESDYFAPFGNHISFTSSAARLSGVPAAFGITSPATDDAMTGAGCALPPVPPPAFAPRCVSTNHFNLLLRDLFTAGVFNVGYVKAPGHYGFYSSQTLPLFQQFLQSIKSTQADKLRAMAPYQRVALHLDADQMGSFPQVDNVGRWLAANLDTAHVPYGLCSDLRSLARLFPKNAIARCAVIAPFHKDLAASGGALLNSYLALAGQTNPAPLVAALTDAATALQLSFPPNAVFTSLPGVLVVQWNPALPFFLLVFPDATVATNQATLTALLPQIWGQAPEPARPFILTSTTTTPDLRSSEATDGLNYYLAVSNRSQTANHPSVTIGADPQLVSRFQGQVSGYVFDTSTNFALGPKQTQMILAKAVVAGLGGIPASQLTAKIASFNGDLLAREAAGFDVAAGKRLVGYLGAINPSVHPERVLAGLVHLANMVFVRAIRGGATILVTAVRHDGSAVAGAAVQALHLYDGHQEQDAGVTNASGQATVVVQGPQQVRWDFFNLQFGVPTDIAPATEPVEVHVHDRQYGSQAFVTR